MATESHGSSSSGQRARGGAVRAPERTCAACRKAGPPESMVRWVRTEEGAVFPDLKGSGFGRGSWLHPRVQCLAKLVPALSRSFRAPVTTSPVEAVALLRAAGDKRVRDLLGAARRQRKMALGSAAAEGLACGWGSKERIGQIVGRPEVGVLAILDDRLAAALFDAIALAHLQGPPPRAEGNPRRADVSTEVE